MRDYEEKHDALTCFRCKLYFGSLLQLNCISSGEVPDMLHHKQPANRL